MAQQFQPTTVSFMQLYQQKADAVEWQIHIADSKPRWNTFQQSFGPTTTRAFLAWTTPWPCCGCCSRAHAAVSIFVYKLAYRCVMPRKHYCLLPGLQPRMATKQVCGSTIPWQSVSSHRRKVRTCPPWLLQYRLLAESAIADSHGLVW